MPENNGIPAANGEIFLTAGEQLTVSSASVEMAANADVAAATAWTQKQIVLNSTPLSDVVDEFNRYNTRQLVITDPKIADTKISGEFSSSNPDSLLKGLGALNKFNIHEMPGQIEISSK
jgi:transmembrane sensor